MIHDSAADVGHHCEIPTAMLKHADIDYITNSMFSTATHNV